MLGWGLASINYGAALWSYTIAQKSPLLLSMLLVLGGGGLRMLVMFCGIIIIMLKKSPWLPPFSTALLGCFVAYLFIEVAVVFKRGLLKQQ